MGRPAASLKTVRLNSCILSTIVEQYALCIVNTELVLTQLLRLSAAIDQAVEKQVAVSDGDVYALVGLVEVFDELMRNGGSVPQRWRQQKRPLIARPPQRTPAVTFDLSALRDCPASNDNAIRTRRERVRRSPRVLVDQLALW
jgi:hypothetical protein